MNIDVRIINEDNVVLVTGYPVTFGENAFYRVEEDELFRVEIREDGLRGDYGSVEWFAHTPYWSDVPFEIRPYIEQYL